MPDQSEQPASRSLAVLIGINDYQNGIPPLRNAVRDVQTVAQLLREQHGYEVIVVLEEQATAAGLRSLLARLPSDVSAYTRLILYFAGHGIADEGSTESTGPQGFLIPQDARRDDVSTYLPMAEFQALLGKLPCKHLLLILDCCFAGAFRWSQTRSVRVRPATLYRERYDRYLRDPAWQVITSAASDERALDAVAGGKLGRRGADDDNSPFAAALCRGLRGEADLSVSGHPGDGIIVANELHVYLESCFSLLEHQLGRSVQKPLLWSLEGRDKGQFIFFTPGRGIALPSALELSEANNPYRGLEPYDENDERRASLFFGRNEVIEQLDAQLRSQPLTVVSGVSGSGKSSLVRIGLVRRLRSSTDWCVPPPIRPGNRPLPALAAIFSAIGAATAADLPSAVRTWRESNREKKLLLFVDQLEELVTMGTEPTDQQAFLDSITCALSENLGILHVVMALRSDFEPHFSTLLSCKLGTQVRFLVRPLNRLELRQVIEGPASERVLYFEPPTLVDQLVDEVAEMPGALPLLSFTMSELYRSYVRSGRHDRLLTVADYQTLHGVAGALSQRADEIYRRLDAAHQGTLQRVMLRMVSLQAGELARRRVPLDELRFGEGQAEEQRKQKVLTLLEEARLIVSGTDNEGTPYVEPAHDKLVLGWPQLWTYIRQEQATIPLQRLLTQAAATWAQKSSRSEHLWSGNPSLPQVIALLQKLPDRFNAQEQEFIQRSAARRRNTRIGLFTASVTAMIVMTVAAVLYVQNLQKVALADANRLAFQSEVLHSSDIAASASTAVKAVAKAANDTTWSSLLNAYFHMDSGWLMERYRLGSESINTLSFSESGQEILIASKSSLRVLSRDGNIKTITLPEVTDIRSAYYRPWDSDQILIAHGRQASIWSLHDAKCLWKLDEDNLSDVSATWSGNGERVLVRNKQEGQCGTAKVRVFSPTSPKSLRTWNAEPAAALSFDGRWVALVMKKSCPKKEGLSEPKKEPRKEKEPEKEVYQVQIESVDPIESVDQKNKSFTPEVIEHADEIKVLSFSPDGNLLAAAFDPHDLRLWHINQSDQKLDQDRVLEGHLQRICSLDFSPDSSMLVSASDEGAALVWSTEIEQSGEAVERVLGLGLAPRSPLLKTLRHISDSPGENRSGAKTARTNLLNFATFSPSGDTVATGLQDGSIALWFLGGDIAGGPQIVGSKPPPRLVPSPGWLASATGHQTVHLVDPAGQGRSVVQMDRKAEFATTTPDGALLDTTIECAALSSDGAELILGDRAGRLSRWKIDGKGEWSRVWTHYAHQGKITSCSLSPDGRLILSTGRDGKSLLWERGDSPRQVHSFSAAGQLGEVWAGAFSHDGKSILLGGDLGKLQMFSLAGAHELSIDAPGRIYSVDFDPSNRRILASFGSSAAVVRLWTRAGQPLAQLQHPKDESVERAIFSRDGAWIISATMGGVVRIWDVSGTDLTGRELVKWQAHHQWIKHLSLSSSGDQLLTAADDDRVRLWPISVAAIRGKLASLPSRPHAERISEPQP